MIRKLTALEIGMTTSEGNAGGVDRYLFSLMHALHQYGIETPTLVAGHPDTTKDMPHVHVFANEDDSMPVKWRKMRGAAAKLVPQSDIVVSHFSPYVFPLLDVIRKKPHVVHFHGPWALESKEEGAGRANIAVKKMLEKLVYRSAKRVIVLSSAFAEIAAREYGIPRHKIRIVPGGVEVERFGTTLTREEARAHLGWPADRPTVVTVRRLVAAKGLDNLIRAAAIVRETVPNVQFMIVGTGRLADALQTQIDEAGLGENVRMVGRIAEGDLSAVYRAADFAIVPSIALEGFGLVVVEALACGTPTLVTPIEGLPEVVRALDPALILEGVAPAQLASGLVAALTGTSKLPSSEACVNYAQRFRWTEIARRIAEVYREAHDVSM